MSVWLLLIPAAYLLGSVSFSVLVVRWLEGRDIRTVGSGNAGATNVLRSSGPWPAITVLVLDIAKGALPVLAARLLAAPGPVVGAVAAAAVVGHVAPVWYGFRGGKGVATLSGALTPLAPLPALLAVAVFALTVGVTRWVSLGSICAIGGFPLLLALASHLGLGEPVEPWLLVTASGLSLLVVAKHHANIGRLLAGTEHRLGESVNRPEGE